MLWVILAVLALFVVLGIIVSFIYHIKVNFVRIIAIMFIIFLITSFIVVLKEDIEIGDEGWITGFAIAYADYISQITSNIGDITGQVINQDWLP